MRVILLEQGDKKIRLSQDAELMQVGREDLSLGTIDLWGRAGRDHLGKGIKSQTGQNDVTGAGSGSHRDPRPQGGPEAAFLPCKVHQGLAVGTPDFLEIWPDQTQAMKSTT